MKMDTELESIQEVRNLLGQAKDAQKIAGKMSQEEINRIVDYMAQAALKESGRLAVLAVEETGFGKVEDKLTKNLFSAKDIYESIKDKKTVGIISRDDEKKVWEIAEPVGIVAGIVPSTNPTSTAIFKVLIAVKTRNAIVISPHPAAAKCTNETVDILKKAAQSAGAPEGLISCISSPTLAAANELMEHKLTNVILATGGSAMVKSAYSSGKPAYGVGPGNVPVFIHPSADVSKAVKQIIHSKTFDYGTICASEQALVVEKSIKHKVRRELEAQGAYFLDDYEKGRIEGIILKNGRLNPGIVGKSPQKLAEMAGIVIEDNCKLLLAEESKVGKDYPLSLEKLTPILAFYTVENEQDANAICTELLELGGLGHTAGIHSENAESIEKFSLTQQASRIVVNSGTTFGGIGATTGIQPSMTLGCGSYGNNITSDNISAEHLLNVKRVAFGIREMESNTNGSDYSNPAIPAMNNGPSISREEIMDIVKTVLQELKL